MKAIWAAAIMAPALFFVSAFPPKSVLIWNRTLSAPLGLYWVRNIPLSLNGFAVLSPDAPAAKWISSRGYLAPDWPIIKRVRAQSGDEICRFGDDVLINGIVVARAMDHDESGRIMPVWTGCLILNGDQYFLLNDHERSLDGRYFGPTSRSEIDGVAVLIIEVDK
jgi:conjugative transfer signal peptidase TraF